jgi:Uma2 family endonuclease
MTTRAAQVSIAEFMALPDDGYRHELVRGEVRRLPPPKGLHGLVEMALMAELGRYLRERALALGWEPDQGLTEQMRLVGFLAGGEFGVRFAVPDDPHQIRGADGAYVPAEQLARVSWTPDEYFPAVPALVIEVISPTDSAEVVAEKVQDYLAGGARRVWCVYPQRRFVQVYDADSAPRRVRGEESLADEDLLPGLAIPLNLIFPRV